MKEELKTQLPNIHIQEDFWQQFHGQVGGTEGWFAYFRLSSPSMISKKFAFPPHFADQPAYHERTKGSSLRTWLSGRDCGQARRGKG